MCTLCGVDNKIGKGIVLSEFTYPNSIDKYQFLSVSQTRDYIKKMIPSDQMAILPALLEKVSDEAVLFEG